jgi:hypothetical protein
MLAAPQNLKLVSKTTAQVVLAWTDPPTGSASPYSVYRGNLQIASGIEALTYTDLTVTANRRYRYTITGFVHGVETPFSDAIDVNVEPSASLTFQAVFQEMPGEGGYPDIMWRWQ